MGPNVILYKREVVNMFNQQKYINEFIKDNYKTLKIRIRKDDKLLMNKINNVKNIKQYF